MKEQMFQEERKYLALQNWLPLPRVLSSQDGIFLLKRMVAAATNVVAVFIIVKMVIKIMVMIDHVVASNVC
jgi:hypothetical protein